MTDDRFYSKFARVYDIGVRGLLFWKTWLRQTIPTFATRTFWRTHLEPAISYPKMRRGSEITALITHLTSGIYLAAISLLTFQWLEGV